MGFPQMYSEICSIRLNLPFDMFFCSLCGYKINNFMPQSVCFMNNKPLSFIPKARFPFLFSCSIFLESNFGTWKKERPSRFLRHPGYSWSFPSSAYASPFWKSDRFCISFRIRIFYRNRKIIKASISRLFIPSDNAVSHVNSPTGQSRGAKFIQSTPLCPGMRNHISGYAPLICPWPVK